MGNSEENTFRALKGDPPIASFWCKFGLHKWTIWEKEEPHSFAGESYVRLHRSCVGCGLLRYQVIKQETH